MSSSTQLFLVICAFGFGALLTGSIISASPVAAEFLMDGEGVGTKALCSRVNP